MYFILKVLKLLQDAEFVLDFWFVLITCSEVARWLSCLHCRLTASRSWVRFPHGGLCAVRGPSSPDLQCSGGLSPGPLCVVCMFSPCSQGVSSTKNPNRKNMQKQNILLSVRD